MNLNDYQGLRVTLTRNLAKANADGHMAEEISGLVEVVAPDGSALVIKPKGSTMNMMLTPDEIEPGSIVIEIEKPRELKARKMGMLTVANARQHMLDRHNLFLSDVNSVTDQEAYAAHNAIMHGNLGHYHTEDEDA